MDFGYVVLQKKIASFDTKITFIPISSGNQTICGLRRFKVQKFAEVTKFVLEYSGCGLRA